MKTQYNEDNETSLLDVYIQRGQNYFGTKFNKLTRTPFHLFLASLLLLLAVLVLKVVAIIVTLVFPVLAIISGLGAVIFAITTAVTGNDW